MFWTPIWPQFDLWPNLSQKLSWRVSFKYYFSYSSFQAEQIDMQQGYVLSVNNGLCSASRFYMAAIFDLPIAPNRGQISTVCRQIWIPHTQIRL